MNALTNLAKINQPSAKPVLLHITAPAQRRIRSGHPWLFANSITKISNEGNAGDLAVIFDGKRKFLAIGLFDPHSPIRVRILHKGHSQTIDRDWFLRRISSAIDQRRYLDQPNTNGYRLIHGENDNLPGLVVDRYADNLVIKIYTPAWIPHLHTVAACLIEILSPLRIILRMNRLTQKQEAALSGLRDGLTIYGPELTTVTDFVENGIIFEADPVKGQKTGFFLDQRENRARVETLSRDRHILNVFSYNGAFSLYAARGGAKSVTSLDISKHAIDGSIRNFALNKSNVVIASCPHHTIVDDAFKAMARLAEEGRRYNLVIIDPPAFAKRQDEVTDALHAYSRLCKLGLRLLAPEGIIVMASCSAHVSADEFFAMIDKTAESAQVKIHEIARTLHAPDHPIGFAEGAYLKCLFAQT